MIQIVVQNGAYLVWSASDWSTLREDNRIVGNMIGSLAGLPRQNLVQGMPLSLLKEEVTLLLEKNIACLLSDKAYFDKPDENKLEKFKLYRETNSKEQNPLVYNITIQEGLQQFSTLKDLLMKARVFILAEKSNANLQNTVVCYEDQRKKQITTMIDRIIEGKKRKLMGLNTKKKKGKYDETVKSEEAVVDLEIDREEILQKELNKSAACSAPPLLVQTFTREQWIDKDKLEKVQWNFPATTQESLKYNVFKDLWEKGFYVTEGHKFGVDYLVYPGDPVKFHAQFLVVCVEYDQNIPCVEFIAYARLASISRKTFVIASQEPEKDVIYQSINWTERN